MVAFDFQSSLSHALIGMCVCASELRSRTVETNSKCGYSLTQRPLQCQDLSKFFIALISNLRQPDRVHFTEEENHGSTYP